MAAMTQQASQSQSQIPPAGLQAAALLFDEEEAAQRRQEVQRRLRKFLIAQRIPLAYIGRYLTGYVDDVVAGGGADDSSMSWSTVADAKVDHDGDGDSVPHRRLNFFFTSPEQVHGARGSPVSAVRQARGAENKKQQQQQQQQRSAELPISFVALAAAAAAAASSPHDCDTVVDSVSVGTQTALSHMTKVAKLRDFRRQHRRDTSSLDATDPNANECD